MREDMDEKAWRHRGTREAWCSYEISSAMTETLSEDTETQLSEK